MLFRSTDLRSNIDLFAQGALQHAQKTVGCFTQINADRRQLLSPREYQQPSYEISGLFGRTHGRSRVFPRCVYLAWIVLQQFQLSDDDAQDIVRSEEHTSELQSLMRISYAVFCLKKKTIIN